MEYSVILHFSCMKPTLTLAREKVALLDRALITCTPELPPDAPQRLSRNEC